MMPKGHYLFAFSLVAFVALLAGALWLRPTAAGRTAGSAGGSSQSMFDEIELRARRAQGADEGAIRELADAVFADPMFAVFPADVLENMKERLVRAEVRYRRGESRTIRERHIYQLVNRLAHDFGAPAYARTSPLQVRIMRLNLMPVMPNFIARETRPERGVAQRGLGSSINPEISPLEAVYLAASMITQKLFNPVWQQTPEEFARNRPWRQRADRPAAPSSAPVEAQFAQHIPPNTAEGRRGEQRRNEMWQFVQRRARQAMRSGIAEMVATSLDTLEIER